jgi:integrase
MKESRKSMANIVQFLDILDKDCNINQTALVAMAAKLKSLGVVDWLSAKWNVTAVFAHKTRGHETRKRKYLNFYRCTPNHGTPMVGPISDVIKAMTVHRFHEGGQGAENTQHFINGWRYIYESLESKSHRLELLTPEDLSNACRRASHRIAETTASNRYKAIHEIADLLDRNRLVKMRLEFRYSGYKRLAQTSGADYVRLDDPTALDTVSSKVADENVLEALGFLYRKIPNSEYADRLRILLTTVSVFLGRRIGEVLTLPALPVQKNEKGTSFLVYYPQKRAQGNLTIVRERIPLPSACAELVKVVIAELLELTAPFRDIAAYIHEHQHADDRCLAPFLKRGWLSSADLKSALGVGNGNQWARHRGLQPIPVPNAPRQNRWPLDEVKRGMNAEVMLEPVLRTSDGKHYLKDSLAVIPKNGCESGRANFLYSVELLNWQHISDFLGSNESRRRGTSGAVKSVFDRYLSGPDIDRLSVNSHAFRHTLNNWLDEGGMSDTAQTKWFGRRNAADTRAYQHTSPAKAALEVHQDLKNGNIVGPVADQLEYIPVSLRDAYVKARVRAVHDVGPGVCFHDFSQMPCERSMQCTADCGDYHWRRDDPGRIDDIKRQYAIAEVAREVSEKKASTGRGKSSDWLAHNEKKLQRLRIQLVEQGVSEFDPHEYLNGGQDS